MLARDEHHAQLALAAWSQHGTLLAVGKAAAAPGLLLTRAWRGSVIGKSCSASSTISSSGGILQGRYAQLTVRPNLKALRVDDDAPISCCDANTQSVTYTQRDSTDAVSIGPGSLDVEHNSVLLLPGLITPEECAAIVADVDAAHARVHKHQTGEDAGMTRYEISDLSDKTQAFFRVVLRERLLPFVSDKLPNVEEMVWARSRKEMPSPECISSPGSRLCEQRLIFSSTEPAVNRYAAAGRFARHTDDLALTLNVLLQDPNDANGDVVFQGGGTLFWTEGQDDDEADNDADALGRSSQLANFLLSEIGEQEGSDPKAPVLLLEPKAGTGVLFNGTVKHAGRAVTAGVRHLLVSSFSIFSSCSSLSYSGGKVNLNSAMW